MGESASSCGGAFRLEYRAESTNGLYWFGFRCMDKGCAKLIRMELEELIDFNGQPCPVPPLGRLYLLRMSGTNLEIREVNSTDG